MYISKGIGCHFMIILRNELYPVCVYFIPQIMCMKLEIQAKIHTSETDVCDEGLFKLCYAPYE